MNRLDQLVATPLNHKPPTVAVAMANDHEVIRCIGKAAQTGLARFILIGPHQEIHTVASRDGVSLGPAEFIDVSDPVAACAATARCVCEGRAQVVMKGQVHTATFTRAFLDKQLDLVPKGSLLSHVAVLDVETYHKLLLMTDGGINIDPDVARKAAILQNAIHLARRIGVQRPKAALLSAIEVVNPKMRSTVDAQELVHMAEAGIFDNAVVAGPLALDVAVSEEAARIKQVTSEVAGDADILLVPNIECGNVLYKTLTQFTSTRVAGLVLGARCPMIITSRSDTEKVKFRALGLAVRSVSTSQA